VEPEPIAKKCAEKYNINTNTNLGQLVNTERFYLPEWFVRLTANAIVATVLGSVLASSEEHKKSLLKKIDNKDFIIFD
jgi:hypothetical protein